MKTEEFDYPLPPELIAQHPAAERAASRLLHLEGKSGALRDAWFRDLPAMVQPGDVMVFNDTRVIKARLLGRKDTGGQVEALIERVLGRHRALAQLRASKAPKIGSELWFAETARARVVARHEDFYELEFVGPHSVLDTLEQRGSLPLPPYIKHLPQAEDELRYQTVYARHPGAVAAPTAGLHFDEPLLAALKERGVVIAHVTLHVGAGTFQPVRVADISQHVMHSEQYRVPEETVRAVAEARSRGGRVIAVGTTTLRTLEAAAQGGELKAGEGETDIFITPGHAFCCADRLITNFHLPKSTLLMLVSAFGGVEPIRAAYRHAIAGRYRFFSYGDAMLIDRG